MTTLLILVFTLQLGLAMPQRSSAIDGHFASGDGVRLYYRKEPGPRRMVVALHGGPGIDSAYLLPDWEPLSRRNTVVYYDQRGSGRSDLPSDPALLSIDHHVRDLEALRVFLGQEKLILVAHSFGPLLAATYAIAHPDRVDRMVFIGPMPPRRGSFWERFRAAIDARLTVEERERMSRASRRMLSGAVGEGTREACREFWSIAMKPRLADPRRVDRVKGDLCAASPEAIRHGMAVTNPATLESLGEWDLRAAVATVTAPTLVIHGEREAIPMDLVEEWTTALPNARLLRIPGAGHFPYVEQPDQVWPEILRFLE